jgi:transcriptional regulator with XRE-family HTH domain
MREEFGPLLRMFRERAKRSRNNLCHEVGCDPSYACRMESGDRVAPSVALVESFARALRLNIHDRNRLLIAAGYAPVELTTVSWDGALQAVADVLSDVNLTPEDRDAFEATVRNIALRWRGAPVQDRAANGMGR